MTTSKRANKAKQKPTSLSHGRPPNAHKPAKSMRSTATRHLINTTHQLNKDLARAVASNDQTSATRLQARLTELGGLKAYQQASIQGQSSERGGDSSIVLLDFLRPLTNQTHTPSAQDDGEKAKSLRLLEIGALSTTNACSRSGLFDVVRIDLHAQTPVIEQQDFMLRPLPKTEEEKFDLISLSLVLNFVPTPAGRGEMLERTCDFLRGLRGIRAEDDDVVREEDKGEGNAVPALFVVLPAPCLINSRYLDNERFTSIMDSLGYVLRNVKWTDRMYYSLWKLKGQDTAASNRRQSFSKTQVNPGPGRNNFSIVLQ